MHQDRINYTILHDQTYQQLNHVNLAFGMILLKY